MGRIHRQRSFIPFFGTPVVVLMTRSSVKPARPLVLTAISL
jgi:hypothetical protein